MRLEAIGLNHRTSSIDVRDRAALTPEKVNLALHDLILSENIEGALILSTCNRSEFYLSPYHHHSEEDLRCILQKYTGVTEEEACDAYILRDEKTVSHLFRVSAGIDSQMLGEVQILAQVKNAYYTAHDEGTSNSVLNKAFLRAIEVGKNVRSNTEISRGAVSVASASVKIAERIFGELSNRRVLLVGAGQTARLAAKHLATGGVDRWRVCNRTLANAEVVADLLGGEVASYPPSVDELAWADLIVTATAAIEPVLTVENMRTAKKKRKGIQLLLDLAVPRDSEPGIGDLPDTYQYTVDDFQDLVKANLKARENEAERAENIIEGHVSEFAEWYQENRVAPTIKQLQETLEELRILEVKQYAKRFHDTDQEQVVLFSKSLIRKVTSLMIANLKRASLEENDLSMAKAVARAVSLNPNGDLTDVLKRLDDELSH
ncbi:glutamyl-tRNA reductase [bacterium BMS3Bbin04]|nr:glutamyl-tRNA reductase [bacterium BMS3Bbin04]